MSHINPFIEQDIRRWGYFFLLGHKSHVLFCNWVKHHKEDINSVLEVGCGYFDYYSWFFQALDMSYTGLDINEKIIDSRKEMNPEQDFVCEDFLTHASTKKYDLVFHHMVLSGTLSVEDNFKVISATINSSNKYGFGSFWNVDNIVVEDLKSFLLEEVGTKASVFTVPTKLSEEQVQHQLIMLWQK